MGISLNYEAKALRARKNQGMAQAITTRYFTSSDEGLTIVHHDQYGSGVNEKLVQTPHSTHIDARDWYGDEKSIRMVPKKVDKVTGGGLPPGYKLGLNAGGVTFMRDNYAAKAKETTAEYNKDRIS